MAVILGSYLADAYDGDIRCRKEVSKRLAHDIRQGSQARKVMESYQAWFGEGPELSVLRLIGLFDRPADEGVIGTLLSPPPVQGITESLIRLNPSEWRAILGKLRRARLLAGADPFCPGYLDHPLVREYFGEQLRCQLPDAWRECNRRLYNYYRTLAPELPSSFREMEPLFSATICGCNAGLLRDALHEVYIPRIQRQSASFAANVLGARGALLSVLAHFFEHERWASKLRTGIEGQSLEAEDELFILIQSGLLLTAALGLGAPEARACYERAEPLCRSLNRPQLLYLALIGQWRYSFMTDKLSKTMRIAKRIYLLARRLNDPALMIGACRNLTFTLYYRGEFQTALRYAMRGVGIWRSGVVQASVEEVNSPVVSCLVFEAMSEWHFGQIAYCRATMAEAISLAKELNDMHGLAVALLFAGILAHLQNDPCGVERMATEVIERSMRQNFAIWLTAGAVLQGWVRCRSGHANEGISLIEGGIRDLQTTGSVRGLPYCLGLKAEALHFSDHNNEALEAIREAEALVERSEERWWSAELHRLRGVFLAALGSDKSLIESSLSAAIRVAKQQKSISIATRAEKSYAEYVN